MTLKKFGLKRSDENIYKNHYSMMNIKQLTNSIDSLEKKLEKKEKHYSKNYTEKFNFKLTSKMIVIQKSSKKSELKEKFRLRLSTKFGH